MTDHLLQQGTMFGRYEIHERIARGGMGEVWFATAHGESGFQKKIVLKTVRPDLAANPGYISMLISEAQLAAQLHHPNIVQVFDLGCTNGVYYIAMEYLPGRTLAQVLHRVRKHGEQVPVWLALSVAASCCDGLQYAHERRDERGRPLGLLHQDISPSNVMLSFNGHVTILDFGVAKPVGGEGESQTLTVKGKYHYMAPERIQGMGADARSDIYSLGVVVYQLLTLHRPFVGANDYELLNRIVNEPPPLPTAHAPWLPGDVERVVIKALAKKPAARYPSAYAMGVELRACLRRIGEVHEARDRAEYISGLFPESPDSMANQSAMASLAESHDSPGAQRQSQPPAPVRRPRASMYTHDGDGERVPARVPPRGSPPPSVDGERVVDLFALPPDLPAEPAPGPVGASAIDMASDPAGEAIGAEMQQRPRQTTPSGGVAALFGDAPSTVSVVYDEPKTERSAPIVLGDIFTRGERGDGDFAKVFNTESRHDEAVHRDDGPDFYRTSRRTTRTTLDYWPWGSDSKQRKAKD